MLLKIPNNSSHLIQDDNASEKMVILVSFDWLLLAPIIWPSLSNIQTFELYGRYLKDVSQKGKIHYSPVTIHLLLFTPNFAYLRGVVP